MGFKYVRFWDIYAPELHLDIHAPNKHYNYSRLNEITDFLVSHHLKPYIELGFKPIRILKTIKCAVKEIERDPQFEFDLEMCDFYRSLIGFAYLILSYLPQWRKSGTENIFMILR